MPYFAVLCGLESGETIEVSAKSSAKDSLIEIYRRGQAMPAGVTLYRLVQVSVYSCDESIPLNFIREFYRNPNPSFYSIPPGRHKEEWIEAHGRSASVDSGLVEVIKAIWGCGWETLGSCEERPKTGRAYVSFPLARQGYEFAFALREAGIACKLTDKVNRYRGDSVYTDIACQIRVASAHVTFTRDDFKKIVELLSKKAQIR